MEDAWAALTRYKFLEDKVKELRRKAWMNLPPMQDIEVALDEAESELAQLRAWIEVNYDTKRFD